MSTASPSPAPAPARVELARWQRFEPVATDAARFDEIDLAPEAGAVRLVPSRSVWFADSRGVALWREVTGDVRLTARVRVRGRSTPNPTSAWSLAGLITRAPVSDGEPESWLYLTTGSDGDVAPTIDSKSTRDGVSEYRLEPAHWDWVELRVTRRGDRVDHEYRLDDGPWRSVRRVLRPDLPRTLQVGLCALTAFEGGEPDLVAEVEDVALEELDARM